MKQRATVIVFAGVDGIVIDRPTGEVCRAAWNAIDLMVSANIPFVLCAGKTRAEIEPIYEGLGLSHPFVCENGAAVFVPRRYFGFQPAYSREVDAYDVVEFGQPYSTVVNILHAAARRVGVEIVGFNDMSVEEIAADCGLPLFQARLAKRREYDEPFRIVRGGEGKRHRLFKALQAAHLGCVNEGRYERAGAPIDPGIGADWLRTWYHIAFGRVLTIGLGNRLSHLPFLRRMDIPLIVPTRDATRTARMVASLPGARLVNADGRGWPCEIMNVVARVAGEGVVQHPTASSGMHSF
jgi:mannosyl-3-phosphoglycerate phosphatase family protein